MAKLDTKAGFDTIRRRCKTAQEGSPLKSEIRVRHPVVSCSANGQHPLVYINVSKGEGRCEYCGQVFVYDNKQPDEEGEKKAA